ncbi:MAG: SEC-C domain-containing protein [Clostridiaceae bacterium]|nr:SEC-C domain-containing protein [Clostridiaceae bacterium]
MSLFKDWQERLQNQGTNENQKFFEDYLEKEKQAYKTILSSGTASLTGRIDELAKKYDMDNTTFIGFLDGINTSLDSTLDLETLTEESEIDKAILLYKLYYNMLNAKANWLYELEEWNDLLSAEERTSIRKKFNEDHRAVSTKVGRNDKCPCGSGKKYKKCCGA